MKLNLRIGDVSEECHGEHTMMAHPEIQLVNRKAEENYVRNILNGRNLRVGTIEV